MSLDRFRVKVVISSQRQRAEHLGLIVQNRRFLVLY
jgi:hypothetical protein